MVNYRDYGYLEGATRALSPINTIKHTQVYQATHDSLGNRLPYMNRSFISFSYGGKWIEDFGLIATIDGDRLTHALYADFVDNTTDLNIFDGQLYWSSHYKANAWDLNLSTDGITEKQLDDVKHWFQPGVIRELILAEHPNRGIMARVSQTPQYSMIPFEQPQTVMVNGEEYSTSTTAYRGDITLSFVMDDPFWYSRVNILDELNLDGSYKTGYWRDANNISTNILTSPDALKIIQEDRVPTASMLIYTTSVPMLFGIEKALEIDFTGAGAIVGYARVGSARVGYAFKNTDTGLTIPQSTDTINAGYFYYAGSAPCAPTLVFSLTPVIDNTTYYVTSPLNSFVSDDEIPPYNTITIESTSIQQFKFTTPSVYTGYNQAIHILTNGVGMSWEEVRTALREHVKHHAPREYAIHAIGNRSGTATQSVLNTIKSNMPTFFYAADSGTGAVPAPIYFTIDCKTGQTTALISYRHGSTYTSADYLSEIAENVGDMVRSNYLLLMDRNTFSTDGYIRPWTEEHPNYSYRIYTDVSGGLENLTVRYKYLYM